MSHISDHIAHASVHPELVYCIFAGWCTGHNFSEWSVSVFWRSSTDKRVPLITRIPSEHMAFCGSPRRDFTWVAEHLLLSPSENHRPLMITDSCTMTCYWPIWGWGRLHCYFQGHGEVNTGVTRRQLDSLYTPESGNRPLHHSSFGCRRTTEQTWLPGKVLKEVNNTQSASVMSQRYPGTIHQLHWTYHSRCAPLLHQWQQKLNG